MSHVERSALVRRSADHMFSLVNDVEAYPRLFHWCEAARVIERGDGEMIARLDLRIGGLRMNFTTRNRWVAPEHIALDLVEGPFSSLSGGWRFDALADDACRVALRLDFEPAGRLLGGVLASGFRGLADRLVDDFVVAARTGRAVNE